MLDILCFKSKASRSTFIFFLFQEISWRKKQDKLLKRGSCIEYNHW